MTTIKANGRDLELRTDQDIVFYPDQNIWIKQGTKLIFEGTVPDDFEAKLQATSVTADRDIILPDESGTLATQEWVNANGGSSYSNSDVDAHLNQSNPTDGYVLSWTSGDYAWVAQSGGGGGSLNNVVEDTTPQLGGNLDLNGNDITGTGNINISGDITSTSAGTPTITSSTVINLTAGTGVTDRVAVTQSPFKLASFTTVDRDAKTSENGDLIYNINNHAVDAYINGSWTSISTGGGISNVVEDTTPQLGGGLDLNSNDITGIGNISITGNLTVSGLTTLAETTEVTSDLTGATGVVVHNLDNGAVFDHTSLAADFTANFTNVPTTTNRTISVVLILSQGATAYIPTAVQIDGVAQTILWQGGSARTGTASGTDVVGFTLIRSSGGAWKIVGSMTGYA